MVKTKRWITKKGFLVERVDFYRYTGSYTKRIRPANIIDTLHYAVLTLNKKSK